jgi:hypothetical protein
MILAHQPRVLVETNDLGKPLKGGVDSSCQISCNSLEHSLDVRPLSTDKYLENETH